MIDKKMNRYTDIQRDDLPEEFRQVADKIGLEAALDLVSSFQGCQLYVPKFKSISRQRRYRRMYDDFVKCRSFKQIAVKYELSESHTRQIIKDEKKRRFPSRHTQSSLF